MFILLTIFIVNNYNYSQDSFSSLNLMSLYDIKPRGGISYILEQGFVTSQINLLQGKDTYIQTKMGFCLDNKKSRYILYPFYFDGKIGEGYRTPTSLVWEKSYKKITWQIGTDFTLTGSASVNLNLAYNIIGKRQGPSGKIRNWRNRDVLGIALSFTGGLFHGFRERYHQNPRIFEQKWGVKPISYFGSESWKLKYRKVNGEHIIDPRYEVKWKTSISDFWHTSNIISKGLIISGTIALTSGENKKFKHYLKDLGVSFVASSFGAATGWALLK